MSGGLYNYTNNALQSDMFGWSDKFDRTHNPMEDWELSELVFDVLNLINRLDLYKCGDIGDKTYEKDKNAFKKKWFKGDRTERLKKIVTEICEQNKKEILKMI